MKPIMHPAGHLAARPAGFQRAPRGAPCRMTHVSDVIPGVLQRLCELCDQPAARNADHCAEHLEELEATHGQEIVT